jgi:hypothetical protein
MYPKSFLLEEGFEQDGFMAMKIDIALSNILHQIDCDKKNSSIVEVSK